MLLDDEVVGVLLLWRSEVDPFDDREIELLTTFAAQAAIAVRQVELVAALEARSAELASKVEQLEALGEVGRGGQLQPRPRRGAATGSWPTPCGSPGTDGGSIMEYDEAADAFVRADRVRQQPRAAGPAAAHRDRPATTTLVGRAAARAPAAAGRPTSSATELDAHLAGAARRRLAVGARGADAAGGPDRRAPWSCAGGRPAASPTEIVRAAARRSPASRRWRSSTPGCSASWSAERPSWRWSASTSRSSWPACPTSCGPRSTR